VDEDISDEVPDDTDGLANRSPAKAYFDNLYRHYKSTEINHNSKEKNELYSPDIVRYF